MHLLSLLCSLALFSAAVFGASCCAFACLTASLSPICHLFTCLLSSACVRVRAAGKDKDDVTVKYATSWLKAVAEKSESNQTSGYTIFAPTDKVCEETQQICSVKFSALISHLCASLPLITTCKCQ